MGLDITAYSKMQQIRDPKDDDEQDEYWDAGHVRAFWYGGMDHSGRGLLPDAWYAETDETQAHGFRAGSYSGYNHWRAGLAEFIGHKVDHYFESGDTTLPFYELINFADNEGSIGPDAAADLLKDFQTHRTKYRAAHDQYDNDRYDDWMRACELAADSGMICFH